MSTIKIKGRIDLIQRPYELAKKIKQRRFGDDTVSPPIPKALASEDIDLGDEWSGTYGQIVSIELNDKPRAPQGQIREPDPTPKQRNFARQAINKIRDEFGFTAKKVAKMKITRSSLNEYTAQHGVDYQIPEGTEIIEDIP